MNELSYGEKVEVLLEAFSYAKKFKDKTIVIKLGGNAMIDEQCRQDFFEDVSILKQLGLKIVIVHGGGPFLDVAMTTVGLQKKTINGLRVTDTATLKIAQQVFQNINAQCVASLKSFGVNAENCTRGLVTTEIKDKQLGLVGQVTKINAVDLVKKINRGIVPIVSSLGITSYGQVTNVNADTVAAEIAIALEAEKLTILTNVDGVLVNGRIISHLTISEANQFTESDQITTGMVPKVAACIGAVKHNVKKAHLINGTKKHALLVELFTPEGIGTELVNDGTY